jgi:hypothetical protein
MLGNKLITNQTSKEGQKVQKVIIFIKFRFILLNVLILKKNIILQLSWIEDLVAQL